MIVNYQIILPDNNSLEIKFSSDESSSLLLLLDQLATGSLTCQLPTFKLEVYETSQGARPTFKLGSLSEPIILDGCSLMAISAQAGKK